jgi:hypothetical protein
MLTAVHPKQPMRDKSITKKFFVENIELGIFGNEQYNGSPGAERYQANSFISL